MTEPGRKNCATGQQSKTGGSGIISLNTLKMQSTTQYQQKKRFTKFKVALDPKIRKKIKEKKKLYKEALNQRTEVASLKYRRVSNQVRNLTRKAEKERERRVADEVKDNPEKFWNMGVKNLLQTRDTGSQKREWRIHRR